MRKMAFENLQRLSLSYYDNRAVGWLMSRMTSDINTLTEAICWGVLDFGFGASMMVAYMIFMLRLNVRLALWAFLVLPVIGLLSFYFHKAMIRVQRKLKAVNSEITAAYNEDIQGAKTTKTLVREELNFKDFQNL
ncbi:ABC transporter transmembrane domain-containing protein, partial [Bacillus licheniformis]|uniref:ABC transporter transmembrane domain-containing protein n=1 Tax=Bacillus licheniformis TaxID=1402 RepID=UPI0028935A63